MGGLIARRVDKAPSAGPEGAKGAEGDGGEVVGEVAVVDDGVDLGQKAFCPKSGSYEHMCPFEPGSKIWVKRIH